MNHREQRARQGGIELRQVTTEEKAAGYIGALVGEIPFESDSQELRDRSVNKGQPFIERLAPDAFKRSLAEDRDQMGFAGHTDDPLAAFARVGENMTITATDRGLSWRALIPDTQAGRDIVTLADKKIIRGTSFEFNTDAGGDTWEKRDGKDVRTITSARLYTVNPVAFPAYPGSELTAERSLIRKAKRRGYYLPDSEDYTYGDATITCDTAFAMASLELELCELECCLEYLRCAGAAGGTLADYARAEVTESTAAVKMLVDFLAAHGAEINQTPAGNAMLDRAKANLTEARAAATPPSDHADTRERRRRPLSVSPVSPTP
jgi:HK97 family phage prohead protease